METLEGLVSTNSYGFRDGKSILEFFADMRIDYVRDGAVPVLFVYDKFQEIVARKLVEFGYVEPYNDLIRIDETRGAPLHKFKVTQKGLDFYLLTSL